MRIENEVLPGVGIGVVGIVSTTTGVALGPSGSLSFITMFPLQHSMKDI